MSENFPVIEVALSGAGGWGPNILSHVYDFEVRDAGIKKISQATINFHNYNGYFTSGLVPRMRFNRLIRIRVDVRGVWDTIFQGYRYSIDPDDYITSLIIPRSRLSVVARGDYGQRCLRDTITHPFYDNGWFAQDALRVSLNNPDSAINTGIFLDTDNAAINAWVCPRNFQRDSLLDAIQTCCEEYGYIGYFDDVIGNLYLRRYRIPNATLSGVNPSIHYRLSGTVSGGMVNCSVKEDIEGLKNHVLVWGSTDQGFPVNELWTESGVTRGWWSKGVWGTGTTTLSDDGTIFWDGTNSIQHDNTSISGGAIGVMLHISGAGYIDPFTRVNPCINLNRERIKKIHFEFRYTGGASPTNIFIYLYDSAGLTAWRIATVMGVVNFWRTIEDDVDWAGQAAWTVAPLFDWNGICRVEIFPQAAIPAGSSIWVDDLSFVGQNWIIDPFTPCGVNWDAPHIDVASIATYGRTVFHYVDNEIRCWEEAYQAGQRILEMYRDPFTRLEITQGAKTWVNPSETVRVSVAPWNISGAVYRVEEVIHRFRASDNLLRTTVNVILSGAEAGMASIQMGSLDGLLKLIKDGVK